MPLFILTETSAGYALLKAKDKKLLQRDNLGSDIATAEQICSEIRLKHFQKFDSAAEALEEVSALVESKVTPRLASLLEPLKDEKKASLAVADPKLGTAINKLPQLSIVPVSDSTTSDLYRAIRDHLPSLIPGLLPSDISTMSLGLSHSLSRHKLRFSPDKIDQMIVQAVALLDDLDKELNTYAMRVKEWYGWHFPEMAKIVNDNIAYARIILAMGMRSNASNADLAEILPEEIETAVKAAAEVSMGTEITKEDLEHIQSLAEQVVGFTEYRQTLSSYLASRMTALAPNLTALVGDLVGARLISHAGSLLNLAKSPASTIQILGAEKALFRALKTKHDTPKYGLIYHASLVGQATGKNKGKIARVLAAKAALGLRADAYANWGVDGSESTDAVPEEEKAALGISARAKIERRLASLEGKPLRPKGVGIAPTQQQPGKWEIKEARKYNPDADGLAGTEPAAVALRTKSTGPTKLEHKARAQPDSDDDMEDDDDDDEDIENDVHAAAQMEAELNGDSSSTAKGTVVSPELLTDDQRPVPLSTVFEDMPDSPDTPTAQQSSALSKKERKKEKRDRKEQNGEEDELAANAAKAGLSVTRYKRKLERGEISWINGEPVAVSKKDIKKALKAAAKVESDDSSKKRKRQEDEDRAEKKKKKKDRKEKKRVA